MGWQWHQLDHMQITCTSLHTPCHSFFTGRMLFLMPNQQCQSTEGKTCSSESIWILNTGPQCTVISLTLSYSFTSHSAQDRSFQRRSSQPVCWPVLKHNLLTVWYLYFIGCHVDTSYCCCCCCYDSYERIEIPLYIQTVDGVSMPCLQSLVRLPDILCQEEDDLYRSAKEACCSDLAAMIHNGSGECSLCD